MCKGYKRVPSFPDYGVSRGGKVINWKTGKARVLQEQNGYYVLSTSKTTVRVHRMVAEAWVAKRPLQRNEIVHHRNGLRTDNRASNLVVCSRAEHMQRHRIMREFLVWAVETKRFKEFEQTRLAALRAEE